MLAEKESAYKEALQCMKEHEGLEAQSEMAKLSLPTVGASDRILRYETAIERQMYRAINQLERMQRQRRGEYTPPPISIDLSDQG